MKLYIPEFAKEEHFRLLGHNEKYKALCDEIVKVKDGSIGASMHDEATRESYCKRWVEMVDGLLSSMPKKLSEAWKIHLLIPTGKMDDIESIVNDAEKSSIVRICALGASMGIDDVFSDSDVKASKPGTKSDTDVALMAEKFFDIYSSLSDSEKNGTEVQCMYQAYYCIKLRYLWYPLGDSELLDDMYSFLIGMSEGTDNGVVILRNDRELNILAHLYRWEERKDIAIEVCDYVIDRPSYKYSYNTFKMNSRLLKAQIKIEKNDIYGALGDLNGNIVDYGYMKESNSFKSVEAGNYNEMDFFITIMFKTYEYLDVLCEKDFTPHKYRLLAMVEGDSLDDKMNILDMRNNRHQWKHQIDKLGESIVKSGKKIGLSETLTL